MPFHLSLSDLRPIGMTRTQENIEMKRTPSTENLDCVLAHLLECSPLMREPACSMPQSYPCLLQSRQKRSEAAALNMYKWHWLQSEGKYQGLAAIICGAGHPTIMPNNPSLSSSSSAKKTTDIPFFSLPTRRCLLPHSVLSEQQAVGVG